MHQSNKNLSRQSMMINTEGGWFFIFCSTHCVIHIPRIHIRHKSRDIFSRMGLCRPPSFKV